MVRLTVSSWTKARLHHLATIAHNQEPNRFYHTDDHVLLYALRCLELELNASAQWKNPFSTRNPTFVAAFTRH